MLSIPDAPAFIPYVMVCVFGVGFAVLAFVLAFVRSRPLRHRDVNAWEARIVGFVAVLFVSALGLAVDNVIYEASHGDGARLAQEIERVYGLEVDITSARTLWDGQPVAIDGATYRLDGDRLEKVEEWSDVPAK